MIDEDVYGDGLHADGVTRCATAEKGAAVTRIAVLVSVGRNPVSGVRRYSRNDALALSMGFALAREHGARCDVLHAGNVDDPALPDYLALGAAEVEVIPCAPDVDVGPIVAARLKAQSACEYDLVLTGTRAEGAFDSGMLPYIVAAELRYPLVDAAVEMKVESAVGVPATLSVRQFLPKGLRRNVTVQLPAVVAVHPLASAPVRYAYARMRSGRVRLSDVPLPVAAPMTTAAGGNGEGRCGQAHGDTDEKPCWNLSPVLRHPVRLAAREKRTGHSRMLSATTTESKGGRVVIEGSSVEKAQAILTYLREHHLIDY